MNHSIANAYTLHLVLMTIQVIMYVGIALFVGYYVRKLLSVPRVSRHGDLSSRMAPSKKSTRASPPKSYPHF